MPWGEEQGTTSTGHLLFSIVLPPPPFFPCAFHLYHHLRPSPRPLPASGKEAGIAGLSWREEGKQLQVLLQALGRFCWTTGDCPFPGVQFHLQCEEAMGTHCCSSIQESQVLSYSFLLEGDTQHASLFLCGALAGVARRAEANSRPEVTWGRGHTGTTPYFMSFLTIQTRTFTVRSFLMSSWFLRLC